MSDVEQWKNRVEEISATIGDLQKERGKLQQMIAEAACPFKPGDVVVVTGRHNPGRWQVLKVEPDYGGWQVEAVHLNKDGKTGRLIRHLDKHDKPMLEQKPAADSQP